MGYLGEEDSEREVQIFLLTGEETEVLRSEASFSESRRRKQPEALLRPRLSVPPCSSLHGHGHP